MNDERDLLVFTDEDGNDIEFEVVDYFDYDGKTYAMLVEAHEHDDDCGCGCGCDCEDDECEQSMYIMEVVENDDTAEFIPVDEEKMDELINVIQDLYQESEEEEI